MRANNSRSRHCRLLCSKEEEEEEDLMCRPCQELLTKLNVSREEKEHRPHLKGAFDKDEEDEQEEEEEEAKAGLLYNDPEDGLPLEIKILKEEPLDDFPGTEAPGEARRRRKKSVKKEGRRKVGTTSFPCPQCPNTFQNQLKMVRHASKKHGLYLPVPLKPGLTRCPFCVEIFNEGDRARLCGIEGRPIIDSSRAWMPPILMP